MFSKARFDLRELVELTEKIASYDATLAANRSIVPEPSAQQKRRNWEAPVSYTHLTLPTILLV